MSDQLVSELKKLSDHFDIPLPLGLIYGSANAKFRVAAEFLVKVNAKLGSSKKEKKEPKE